MLGLRVRELAFLLKKKQNDETGSFILAAIRKINKTFRFLTIASLCLLSLEGIAQTIQQKDSGAYLRWSVKSPKDHLVIQKEKDSLFIKTLNLDLYEQIKKQLASIEPNSKYIKSFKSLEPTEKTNHGGLKLVLEDKVEAFSFFRDREQDYVIDFWLDEEEVKGTVSAVERKQPSDVNYKNEQSEDEVSANAVVVQPVAAIKEDLNLKPAQDVSVKNLIESKEEVKVQENPFKDFRYGASFVWDYAPIEPTIQEQINITRKTPEFFYPIVDRKIDKGEKEAHLQLTINMYRKKKWGLMYKSMELFERKYGDEEFVDDHEYLKANALLRNNFENGIVEPSKPAIAIFESIAARTTNYALKRAVRKYLSQYRLNNKDFVSALDHAKKLYVESKDAYDYEESAVALETIFYTLARLGQIEKIEELLKEKTVQKIISSGKSLGYEIFAHAKLGNREELIKIYEGKKGGIKGALDPSVIFNVAETYFQMADYAKAIELFDEFISKYSGNSKSADARLRIALAYDLEAKDPAKVEELYKTAINRSQKSEIQLEARIRYVGHRSIRKNKIDKDDKEIRVFLEFDESEKNFLNKELKELLWLVRLRTFVKDNHFADALRYLNSVPLTSLTPSKRKVFEADGAEIVYGYLLSFFQKSEFSKVVQTFEMNKDKYVNKVANDPYINYVVGKSFIKLKLFDNFDKLLSRFQSVQYSPDRTFPVWSDRPVVLNSQGVVAELRLLHSLEKGDLNEADKNLEELMRHYPNLPKNQYFKGKLAYLKGKDAEAIANFENYFASQNAPAIHDPIEVAELINNYTDALFRSGKIDRFQKVSSAILSDTALYQKTNTYMQKVRERLSYLGIELAFGSGDQRDFLLLESKVSNFIKEFPESIYRDKIDYILAVSFINNKKTDEGKQLLDKLLSGEKVSNHIKELAKSELALLKIKEKTF